MKTLLLSIKSFIKTSWARAWSRIRWFTRTHPFWFAFMILFSVSVTTVLVGTLVFLESIERGHYGPLPEREDLVDIVNFEATEVYAADSSLLGRYYFENRSPVKYEDISPWFIKALLATEDIRFFEHNGLDWRSWARVLFKTVIMQDRSSGGGSTLTQQLAKNLYPRQDFDNYSLIINKLKEVKIAFRLERLFTKEQILELYLNTVPFSENTYGLKIAAERFFNTLPEHLSPEHSAVLVGMLKATTTYNPVSAPERSLARRNLILRQMQRYEYLDESTTDSIVQEELCLNYKPQSHRSGPAPYYREHLRLELRDLLSSMRKPNGMAYNLYTDGLRVYTSIDPTMQGFAEEAVEEHLIHVQQEFDQHLKGRTPWEVDTIFTLAKSATSTSRELRAAGFSTEQIDSVMSIPRRMEVFNWNPALRIQKMSELDSIRYYLGLMHAGFLAMDPRTGEVKAWVGGIDYRYFQYDHVKSRRSVGSTFKPFVYAAALEGGIHPCAYISNVLRTYSRYENWQPRNSDDKYGGLYSMEGALANSVNTVTVHLAMRAGPENIVKLASRLGFRSDIPAVPSIALGAAEASLLELVQAYGGFANRGERPEIHTIRRIETADGQIVVDLENYYCELEHEQVLTVDQADMITRMLRTAVDQGTGRRLRFRYQFSNELAGKTGTSQNHSDGWFVGYTPHLVAGVWVGALSPAVRFRDLRLGQGANTALPIFALFLRRLNNHENFRDEYARVPFPKPSQAVLDAMNCPQKTWPQKAPTSPPDSVASEAE